MPYDYAADSRIDPHIRAFMSAMPPHGEPPRFTTREEVVADAQTPASIEKFAKMEQAFNFVDNEAVAPSAGLKISVENIVSSPDGNEISLRFIRPDSDEILPCIYYIHGGGMAVWSCFWGHFRAWGKVIAAQGVAVVMVDFRNSLVPSSAKEIAPFPAGLNDCVSGLKWVHDHASQLKIDASKIVVAGDSGGGNLTLATALKLKREGSLGLIKGAFAICPYLLGRWPDAKYPSSIENNHIVLNLDDPTMPLAYGPAAYDARDPLAWPLFATAEDLAGLPPTYITVNECDPLRDEGLAFYRALVAAGVRARCRQTMGATHGIEIFPNVCPDISRDTARFRETFMRTEHSWRTEMYSHFGEPSFRTASSVTCFVRCAASRARGIYIRKTFSSPPRTSSQRPAPPPPPPLHRRTYRSPAAPAAAAGK